MGASYDNMHWTEYAELYCRELGLCAKHEGGEGWGGNNQDPCKVEQIARYYLDHPLHSRVGREMILYCLLTSSDVRLEQGPMSPSEEMALYDAIMRAIGDLYDRDVVAFYWEAVPDAHGESPLSLWIKKHFPGWTPPPSIWSTM
jgi:hypothetical protein